MCACAIQVQRLLYCSIRDDSKQSCRVLSCCSLNEAFITTKIHVQRQLKMAELVRLLCSLSPIWSILLPPLQHREVFMIMLKFYLLCQHYASIMPAEWKYRLCPKLCRHNSLRPSSERIPIHKYIITQAHAVWREYS